MALKVVHINKQTIEQEKAAKELWENVLKPKWEARAKAKAEKLFAAHKQKNKGGGRSGSSAEAENPLENPTND